MSDAALVDWFVPAVSLASLAFWLMALKLAMPFLRADTQLPADVRYPVVAAVVIAAAVLAVSSLAYPDLLPADWSRFLLLALRTSLLITGAMAWWELRR